MIVSKRQRRAAFLLNANAKSVTKNLVNKLAKIIPKDDLYISHNLFEAEENIATILSRGYAYLFCGGGDGTAVSTINLLNEYIKKFPYIKIPQIGVLSLGTGNALARLLCANNPEEDIKAILAGKSIKPLAVSMVETQTGQLTPFAGIGYDGELLNDFESVKEVFFESPFRKFFSSVLGFSLAGLFKTLPRQIARELPIIKISTSYPAYRMMEINGVDEEIYLENAQNIYQDFASLICVGTIPSVGYGITMFPFANRRPGYMHLRISAVPLSICLTHLYPSIWHGYFRHKKLYDFLVKDVMIESEKSLPYHLGGDAMGYKNQLYFKISKDPVLMGSITKQKKVNLPRTPLLMTPLT
jgi:diacylglycerol kinase family enzyme